MLNLAKTYCMKFQKVQLYTICSTFMKYCPDLTGIIQVFNIKYKSFAELRPHVNIISFLLLQN